ncbi:hypothetical protein C1646_723644 [Rhizophagus diaphanus]|nr:hypothetical protein C1646_723644 [Rhizophagus diaphanus] [Rhizophagus sp. MUCL 43196]
MQVQKEQSLFSNGNFGGLFIFISLVIVFCSYFFRNSLFFWNSDCGLKITSSLGLFLVILQKSKQDLYFLIKNHPKK